MLLYLVLPFTRITCFISNSMPLIRNERVGLKITISLGYLVIECLTNAGQVIINAIAPNGAFCQQYITYDLVQTTANLFFVSTEY